MSKLLKQWVPQPLKGLARKLKDLSLKEEVSRTAQILEAAEPQPQWLDYEQLRHYFTQYPLTGGGIDEGRNDLDKFGAKWSKHIKSQFGHRWKNTDTVLELGCGNGMIGKYFLDEGKTVTGIDLRDIRANAVRTSTLAFHLMNAEALDFPDNTFDAVYSMATLEHIINPDKAVREAVRVLKKGGYLYLSFGPLYWAPFGLHAYNGVGVPYCHVLFDEQDLRRILLENDNVTDLYTVYVNKKTIGEYRRIWAELDPMLEFIKYEELNNYNFIDLVRKHPTCFKHKSDKLEDFTVSTVNLLAKKK